MKLASLMDSALGKKHTVTVSLTEPTYRMLEELRTFFEHRLGKKVRWSDMIEPILSAELTELVSEMRSLRGDE